MNGYHEGLACEHRYLDNEAVCGDPALVIISGIAFCQTHFEDRIVEVSRGPDGERQAAELRFAARVVGSAE